MGVAAGLLSCLLSLACVPSAGPFRLAAAQGRVVDVSSGAAVPRAEVFQWYRGARGASDAHPTYHARFTRADESGRFAFPAELVTSPRIWLLRTEGPSWGVYAEAYGFQRPRPVAEGDDTLLRLSPADAAARRASLAPFCDRRSDDAASRRLAALACDPLAASTPR
jgi:hypothetical protein